MKSYPAPRVDVRELLRYAKVGGAGCELDFLDSLIEEASKILSYNVRFCKLNFTISGDICDFGEFSVKSKSLAENLKSSEYAILFLASVGHGIDRLIAKYGRTSPASAVLLQALGTERVEALADEFCRDMGGACPSAARRFSPGYGDLPLEVQRDIFRLLSPEQSMGVYLSDSLFMSPSKSVTAFFGVGASL